jgi:CMP-N,N'-diacetyllegionaminic acid synthase
MKTLYVIPARGGSKGIPHKNIRLLAGKPLICYSIDVARVLTTDDNICVSTDDDEIIKIAENYGLKIPFKRPDALASDDAATSDVLVHALNHYENQGLLYDIIVLLQPTSPLRTPEQVRQSIALYKEDIDMVVSVKVSHSASVLCQENEEGYLDMSVNKLSSRRQENGIFYEYNGAIYVINARQLKKTGIRGFTKKVKYIMDEETSVDIDSMLDFDFAEFLIERK